MQCRALETEAAGTSQLGDSERTLALPCRRLALPRTERHPAAGTAVVGTGAQHSALPRTERHPAAGRAVVGTGAQHLALRHRRPRAAGWPALRMVRRAAVLQAARVQAVPWHTLRDA